MMKALISCGIKTSNDTKGDFLYLDYTEYFGREGVSLIPVSNAEANPGTCFDRYGAEGLVLSGGNDIGSFPERDRQEGLLLDAALERGLPVFGICRGMQFVNRYFGGAMPVEIRKVLPGAAEHVASEHPLEVVDAGMAGLVKKKEIMTNSFHNYGVTRGELSPELRVVAVSRGDGVIEALCHKEYPMAAVQWHPERKSPDDSVNSKLVEAFRRKDLYWRAQ